MTIEIEVGQVTVETAVERQTAQLVPAALREAFLELGKRLQSTPFERWSERGSITLDVFEIETSNETDVGTPAFVALLIDHLYEQLLRRTS